jgi:hypothetical protein
MEGSRYEALDSGRQALSRTAGKGMFMRFASRHVSTEAPLDR